jgi:hypothetical protein
MSNKFSIEYLAKSAGKDNTKDQKEEESSAKKRREMARAKAEKKRVQCQNCGKSFCDKGALKIHNSAVHLREMHK